MTVKYDKLFEKLKKEGITQTVFKTEAKISANTLVKMLHNESITVDSICKICDFFCCMPDEIMEFIPEVNYEERREAKANIKQQIENLQKQFKEI
jgi:DNA-binding Xre family transcriptional regulator|nr:MAG TPA: Cro/C1-type HTH DNA-binding domain protein [Bacteriophage sp.]